MVQDRKYPGAAGSAARDTPPVPLVGKVVL